MKPQKIWVISAAILALTSCAQENDLPENKDSFPASSSFRVDLKDALNEADRIISQITGVPTRGKTVKSIEYLGGTSTTRSESDSPLYYVVNYDNDEGFAVLGADKRLAGVYAISGEGHLNLNDTSKNEGLKMFFNSLPKRLPSFGDSIANIEDPTYPEGFLKKNDSYRVEPMLDPQVRKWRQESPFNLLCFYYKGFPRKPYRSLAGCVPLATAMLMSYYEWPVSYNGTVFNWKEMKGINPNIELDSVGQLPYNLQSVPKLLAYLGDRYGTTYFNGGAATLFEEGYSRVFSDFGYEVGAFFQDFSESGMEMMIKNNKPCLVSGKSSGGGHAWVIDGLIFDDDREYCNPDGSVFLVKPGEGYLFHVVWGWNGESNGYFRYNNGLNHSHFTDPDDKEWEEDWEDSFAFTLRYCGDFTPIR